MFSSAQTPGRSLQDDTVELPFVCPDLIGMLQYKLNKFDDLQYIFRHPGYPVY